MSTILEKTEAQRTVNKRGCPRHLIGPNELGYLYEVEQSAEKMKVVGDMLASLLPTTEAAAEWRRITKDLSGE